MKKIISPEDLRKTSDSSLLTDKEISRLNDMLLDRAVAGYYDLKADGAEDLGLTDDRMPGLISWLRSKGYWVQASVVNVCSQKGVRDTYVDIKISWLRYGDKK